MAAGSYDLEIEQGVTEARDVVIEESSVAVDITGWTFSAEIRANYGADDVLATATCVITDGAAGEMTFTFSDDDTAAIPYREGRNYVWDLKAVKGDGTTIRILMGEVIVSPMVTE